MEAQGGGGFRCVASGVESDHSLTFDFGRKRNGRFGEDSGPAGFGSLLQKADLSGRWPKPSQKGCNEKRERHSDDCPREQTSALTYIHVLPLNADGLGGISRRCPQSGNGCSSLNI